MTIQRAFLVLLLAVSDGWAADGQLLDAQLPAETNYAVAAFRFWHPADAKVLRDVLVLVPGFNDDGRVMAQEPFWQAFAQRHQLGLVACCFKDGSCLAGRRGFQLPPFGLAGLAAGGG